MESFEKAIKEFNLRQAMNVDLGFSDPIEDIVKGGEGSRGGKVIGHTKSGKPIYDTFEHEGHKDFNAQDHKDAADAHHKIHMKELSKEIYTGHHGEERDK